ncbi:hypothetical protein N7495_006011 [Penicillium taxi]|uniref:uncharacterized protein n=1 Tax=Penicillium taxi TaxID=168475 RepID=UPI002545008A|nr:uncharacterized protein N7495_006011 [Penicillium taxi]KAJ5894320.1 hypothetical protein N7495_006011 [Penicillium taxi]
MESIHKLFAYSQTAVSYLDLTVIVTALNFLTTRFHRQVEHISLIKKISEPHETVQALQSMIEVDGAGTWPPKASYRNSWPVELRPYHDIFIELAPLLPVMDASLDDTVNKVRRTEYQNRLRGLLQERVNIANVEGVLSSAAVKSSSVITNQAYNGFYACISYLRHAFRWGIVPIVKIAQQEKIIEFPPELDLPWGFICQWYGIQSQGGNVMSNFHCNLGRDGSRLEYAINGSMPEPIPSAEYYLVCAFTEPERRALPVYYHLIQSIICFEVDQKKDALSIFKESALKVYYEYIIESRVPRGVFKAYIQGFHGWAAGEMVDNKYVEYDGTSGAHLVLFNVLDYFLGLEPFLGEQDYVKYFSSSQRRFMASIRAHAFRTTAKQANDADLVKQFEDIAKQLRVWLHQNISEQD